MKKIAAFVALLGLLATPATAQDEPDTFTPASAWAADYGEDYCRLARDFSDGDEVIAFAIERIQPTSAVKLYLVGDSIRLFRGADTLGYRYLPSGGEREGIFLRSQAEDSRQLLVVDGMNIGPDLASLFGGPGGGRGPGGGPGAGTGAGAAAFTPGTPFYDATAELAFAEDLSGIELGKGTLKPVRIETGSLKNVIGALQDCTYDLLTYWGIDGQKHRTISRTVVPVGTTATLPQGTVGFADFGRMAGGVNQVRLMIDESGSPTSCHIHMPSLDQSTNDDICEHLMGNARFEPALDAEGQPMASYWISSPAFMFSFGGT